MTKILSFLLILWLVCFQVQAQTTLYGFNNYTQYHVGNLPIIISVPHGGLVTPAMIPDRTCGSPTYALDARTIELSRQIDTALYNLTGCRPHLIICNLRRTKVDCNRNLADGACGNINAVNAWNDFQRFIDTAQLIVQNQYGSVGLYIDLHGHGKRPHRLELGYGLFDTDFDNPDSVLNTTSYISDSSIENLVHSNVSGSTHAQLLRGPRALGTLFANAGFPSVPSQSSPTTDGFPYFRGGYNTFTHTCIAPGNNVDGLQIECDSAVRFGYANRKRFADSTARILARYYLVHRNLDLQSSCGLIPLPIELVEFSGKGIGKKNMLFWKTSNEINNDYFTVLKSADGFNFEAISKIKGAGNSSQMTNYTFEDAHLINSINYYKLQQTDYDGKSKFSRIIAITNSFSEISVFPNQVSDILNVAIGEDKGTYNISLINLQGLVVQEFKNQNKLYMANLNSGLYFIQIRFENGYIWNGKILKQ